MKLLFKKALLIFGVIFFSTIYIFAEKTPIENLHQYNLDNGLTSFIIENHTVPLVYIEVIFRCGAIAQTKENAGLFHLYEHMMFKGNSKYKNSQEMQTALSDLGVPEWNGSTGNSHVNYYITVPSSHVKNGLEFWSNAVRNPLLDEREFEAEKKVVLSELYGYISDPIQIASSYLNKVLFKDSPFKMDPLGDPSVIQNATLEQLKEIKNKYYVPNNAAVIVAGDITPEKAEALIKEVFGDWQKASDPWQDDIKQYDKAPLDSVKYAVLPYDRISKDLFAVEIYYRGPDGEFDVQDTYVADKFINLASENAGVFKKTILKEKDLNIPTGNYISMGYSTSRRSAILGIYANLMGSNNIPARTKTFYETVVKKSIPALLKDRSIDSKSKKKKFEQSLKDNRVFECETANSLASTISFWFANTSADYFYSYNDKMMEVSREDLNNFANEYIYDKNPLVVVSVNPEVYEQNKAFFEAEGFEEITSENAFWWK